MLYTAVTEYNINLLYNTPTDLLSLLLSLLLPYYHYYC